MTREEELAAIDTAIAQGKIKYISWADVANRDIHLERNWHRVTHKESQRRAARKSKMRARK